MVGTLLELFKVAKIYIVGLLSETLKRHAEVKDAIEDFTKKFLGRTIYKIFNFDQRAMQIPCVMFRKKPMVQACGHVSFLRSPRRLFVVAS